MRAHGPTDIINHLIGHKGFDYDKITDEIYIGTNMCCQMGFSEELLTKGVRADVSLEKDRTDAPDGVDYFLWLPTEDETAPTPDTLKIGIMFLDFVISNKIKTFLHCRHGHGRAPTLFAAYLISRGSSVSDAIKFMTSKRPTILLNEVQVKALNEFKESMKTTN